MALTNNQSVDKVAYLVALPMSTLTDMDIIPLQQVLLSKVHLVVD